MVLPQLTSQQREEALAKATAARRRRAEVKTALKQREITLGEFFQRAQDDEALAKMRVRSLLESLPRVGSHRAEQVMQEVGISATRRVRGLGRVQREALLARFA